MYSGIDCVLNLIFYLHNLYLLSNIITENICLEAYKHAKLFAGTCNICMRQILPFVHFALYVLVDRLRNVVHLVAFYRPIYYIELFAHDRTKYILDTHRFLTRFFTLTVCFYHSAYKLTLSLLSRCDFRHLAASFCTIMNQIHIFYPLVEVLNRRLYFLGDF